MTRIFKIATVNLLIVIALLAVADRFFEKKSNLLRRSIILKEILPHRDFYETPRDTYMEGTDGLEKKPYRIRTDADGFITGPDTGPSAVKNADFVFLGGSTVECWYVDEHLRFPYLVGQILKDKTSLRKVKTLNGGVSGNHSLHSTLNFLAKVIPYRPKAVLLMHNLNDLALLSKTGSYWDAPATRALVQTHYKEYRPVYKYAADMLFPNIGEKVWNTGNNLISRFRKSVPDEWAAYRTDHHSGTNISSNEQNIVLKKENTNSILNTEINKNETNKNDFACTTLTDYEIIQHSFEESLNAFIGVSRAFGIEVILMTQFNRMNPYDPLINPNKSLPATEVLAICKYYHSLNEKIRRIAAREKLLLIDLAEQIPANSDYIYDSVY